MPIGALGARSEACRQAGDWQRDAPVAAAEREREPLGAPAPASGASSPTCARRSRDSGLAPERSSLEITESVLMHDTPSDRGDARRELKALGVRRRRRRLRDRLLVAELPAAVPGRHPQDRPLVRRAASSDDGGGARSRAIVELGRALGLRWSPRASRTTTSWPRCAARLRPRPGLPLRPADAACRGPEAPAFRHTAVGLALATGHRRRS